MSTNIGERASVNAGVNSMQRQHAKAIATGKCPVAHMPEAAGEKAKIHGLVAQILANVTLADVKSDVSSFTGETIRSLGVAVQDSLIRHAETARLAGPYKELDAVLVERANRRGGGYPFPSRERINQGIKSGVISEGIVLSTISRLTEDERQEPLSRRALLASGRVPFKIALLHATGFENMTSGTWLENATLRTGETTKVFTENSVALDPENGLRIVRNLPVGAGDTRPEDPQLGCPVTLVKDFMYNVHTLTADAAVEAGFITLQPSAE